MNDGFHLYLDSADLAELRAWLPHPVVHGVTTHPTLLQRAGVGRAAVPGLSRKVCRSRGRLSMRPSRRTASRSRRARAGGQ